MAASISSTRLIFGVYHRRAAGLKAGPTRDRRVGKISGVQKDAAVEALLRSYPEDVQILVLQARKTVREWLPDVGESVDASARMLAYSYAPGYKGMVCTLLLSKSGVKLGLVGGAALADPRGLLAGAGKVHRHVQLRTVGDLKQAGLKQLVLGASAACRKRLDS